MISLPKLITTKCWKWKTKKKKTLGNLLLHNGSWVCTMLLWFYESKWSFYRAERSIFSLAIVLVSFSLMRNYIFNRGERMWTMAISRIVLCEKKKKWNKNETWRRVRSRWSELHEIENFCIWITTESRFFYCYFRWCWWTTIAATQECVPRIQFNNVNRSVKWFPSYEMVFDEKWKSNSFTCFAI